MRENIRIVKEGIKKLRENNKLWRREQKIVEGNVVKKDSLLCLTILIDSFQIAVYLTLFVIGF